MSYSYNYDSPYKHQYNSSQRTKPEIILFLFIVITAFIALFKYCNKNCTVEEDEPRPEYPLVRTRSEPSVAVISEISNRRDPNRRGPVITDRVFEQYTMIADTEQSIQSLLNDLPRTPQPAIRPRTVETPSAPTRSPPNRSDSIPQYENPPNYEEAITFLNVKEKKNDQDKPIT